MNYHDLDDFTRQYIQTALWSSTDDDGIPLDEYHGFEDINEETLGKMIADCNTFQGKFWDDICHDLEKAGCDFWLTRNRHGAGFWDGSWPEVIESRLTNVSHVYGLCELYIGDDNKIYAF